MKTTLIIEDSVMRQLKEEAARRGCTMSELVESALRLMLLPGKRPPKVAELPAFSSGGALVEIADRDALYQAMEGRWCSSSTPTCWSMPPIRTRSFTSLWRNGDGISLRAA